jgi:hypothetical protein
LHQLAKLLVCVWKHYKFSLFCNCYNSYTIGGAISQARGAVTSWWSNLTTAQDLEDEKNAPVVQDI